MAVEPRRGGEPRNSHGLEEEVDDLMKSRGHMLQHNAGYPVESRCFVVWCAAEGLLEDSRGDLADQHWVRRSGSRSDVAEPGKGNTRRKCGVRGESCGL